MGKKKKTSRKRTPKTYDLASIGLLEALADYLEGEGVDYKDVADWHPKGPSRATLFRALRQRKPTSSPTIDALLSSLGFRLVAPSKCPVR